MKRNIGLLLYFTPVVATAHNKLMPDDEQSIPEFLLHWLVPAGLIVAVVIAGILLLRFMRSSKRGKPGKKRVSNDRPQFELATLTATINSKVSIADFRELEDRLKIIENKLKEPESKELQKEWTGFNQTSSKQKEEPAELNQFHEDEPIKPISEIFYAKLTDIDNGFSSGVLLRAQNGEQIYEIETNGDTAVYRISDDTNAQKYALGDFSFTLGKACELLNQPFRGCRILMRSAGTLNKTAGNWIINTKAVIEFK